MECNNESAVTDLVILLKPISKIVDRGSGQGAGQRKSGAYTAVCEHFELARNAALDP